MLRSKSENVDIHFVSTLNPPHSARQRPRHARHSCNTTRRTALRDTHFANSELPAVDVASHVTFALNLSTTRDDVIDLISTEVHDRRARATRAHAERVLEEECLCGAIGGDAALSTLDGGIRVSERMGRGEAWRVPALRKRLVVGAAVASAACPRLDARHRAARRRGRRRWRRRRRWRLCRRRWRQCRRRWWRHSWS